jgi:predicted nucleic acid-binding Zn ribbon protein
VSRVTLAQAITEFARSRHIEKRLREADIFRLWPDIVGPRIAERAKPVRLRRGRLVVECVDAVWRTELKFLTPELLEQIRRVVGEGLVDEIFLK